MTLGHSHTLEKVRHILALGEEDAISRASDDDAKEVVEVAEDVGEVITLLEGKERGVGDGSSEDEVMPCTGSLLQAVEGAS